MIHSLESRVWTEDWAPSVPQGLILGSQPISLTPGAAGQGNQQTLGWEKMLFKDQSTKGKENLGLNPRGDK